MESEILKFCLGKGVLLDKETLHLLSGFDAETAKDIIEKITCLKEKMITRAFFSKNAEKIQDLIQDQKVIEKLKITFGMSFEILRETERKEGGLEEGKIETTEKAEKREYPNNLKILKCFLNKTKKIGPQDFVKHFRNRYNEMKGFLQDRKELGGLVSINKINGKKQGLSILACVLSKRTTKNKNIFLDVEDSTGQIRILINKDKAEVYDKAKEVLEDDIIGIKGFGNREIIFANDIIYPDISLQEKNRINRDEGVAFISDVHVGSKMFLEKNFLKFIEWLNGNVGDEKQKEEARKIKYLFVTGDNVDGVGVFPGQQEVLIIEDIKLQYKRFAELLGMIRKDITIVVCPGQHDSVWVGQPQPQIQKEYSGELYELENVVLVSNPAMVEILGERGERGMKILIFHGASMISYINEIESLRISKAHDHPSRTVKELLKRRHLAAIHSSVDYVPNEDFDYLIINMVPDIITTADLHKADVDTYNNILIICSSCWQSITPFEEKVGNHPDPCKVPVFNLKTREIKILDFSELNEGEADEKKEELK